MKRFTTCALVAIVLTLGACDMTSPGPVNPTHGGPNGECMEADGEPCDDDPFDTDDLFYRPKVSRKPAPVRPPKPVTTRRR